MVSMSLFYCKTQESHQCVSYLRTVSFNVKNCKSANKKCKKWNSVMHFFLSAMFSSNPKWSLVDWSVLLCVHNRYECRVTHILHSPAFPSDSKVSTPILLCEMLQNNCVLFAETGTHHMSHPADKISHSSLYSAAHRVLEVGHLWEMFGSSCADQDVGCSSDLLFFPLCTRSFYVLYIFNIRVTLRQVCLSRCHANFMMNFLGVPHSTWGTSFMILSLGSFSSTKYLHDPVLPYCQVR